MQPFRSVLFVFISLCTLVLYGCANPIRPDGGPRDKQAPRVDSTSSTPFSSTNFDENKIVITFDEWVRLKNPQTQIVISPPPEKFPEVRVKGKSVVMEFEEDLRPNTTYTINFGEAVEDLTESNKAKDLRFVFSTGNEIDSLFVRGTVVDAYTGEGQEDVLVMLYANMEDSVIYKENPYYFARTNGSGSFTIENLKEGKYKALALKDENFNYRFDLESEQIAFLEKEILLTDSFASALRFLLFQQAQPLQLKTAEATQYGRIRFELTEPPQKINLQHLTDERGFSNYAEIDADSILYWYDMPTSPDKQQFVLFSEADFRDSIEVSVPTKDKFLESKPKVKLMFRTTSSAPASKGKAATDKYEEAVTLAKRQDIPPGKPTDIEFNHPLYKIEGTNIVLLEDSIKRPVVPVLEVKKNARRILVLDYDWKEGVRYELNIPAGALTDIYGLTNDSLRIPYQVNKIADYSTLDLTIDSLEKGKHYLIELLDSKGKLIENMTATNGEIFQRSFPMLSPTEYSVRVVEDTNKNGKWDSGNYLKKQQPEKVYIKQITGLRPDWDVETVMSLKDPPKTVGGKGGKGKIDKTGTPTGDRPKSLGKGRN